MTFVTAGFTSYKRDNTLYDELKDNFDLVYSLKQYTTYTGQKTKFLEDINYDTLFRKSTKHSGDPHSFVLQLANINLGGRQKFLNESDFNALYLPLVFIGRDAYVMEDDTNESIKEKLEFLHTFTFMFRLRHWMLRDIDFDNTPATFDKIMNVKFFGDCNVHYSIKENEETVSVTIRTKRDECSSGINKWLLDEVQKHGGSEVDGESMLTFYFKYERETGRFLNSYVKIEGKLVGEEEVTFYKKATLTLRSDKQIVREIDETKNSKLLEKSDWMSRKFLVMSEFEE